MANPSRTACGGAYSGTQVYGVYFSRSWSRVTPGGTTKSGSSMVPVASEIAARSHTCVMPIADTRCTTTRESNARPRPNTASAATSTAGSSFDTGSRVRDGPVRPNTTSHHASSGINAGNALWRISPPYRSSGIAP